MQPGWCWKPATQTRRLGWVPTECSVGLHVGRWGSFLSCTWIRAETTVDRATSTGAEGDKSSCWQPSCIRNVGACASICSEFIHSAQSPGPSLGCAKLFDSWCPRPQACRLGDYISGFIFCAAYRMFPHKRGGCRCHSFSVSQTTGQELGHSQAVVSAPGPYDTAISSETR